MFPTHVGVIPYKDIIIHELGHIISYNIAEKNNLMSRHAASGYIVRKAWEEIKNNGKYDSQIKAIADISKYAKTNISEALAEGFADAVANGKHAKPLSKAILKIIKQELKK